MTLNNRNSSQPIPDSMDNRAISCSAHRGLAGPNVRGDESVVKGNISHARKQVLEMSETKSSDSGAVLRDMESKSEGGKPVGTSGDSQIKGGEISGSRIERLDSDGCGEPETSGTSNSEAGKIQETDTTPPDVGHERSEDGKFAALNDRRGLRRGGRTMLVSFSLTKDLI